jgi:hypothetical protein
VIATVFLPFPASQTPISNENGIASNPVHRIAAVAKVVPDEEAVEMPISHGFRITTELRFTFTIAGVGESPAFPAVEILRIASQVALNGHLSSLRTT